MRDVLPLESIVWFCWRWIMEKSKEDIDEIWR
jgi:hypothetical protein